MALSLGRFKFVDIVCRFFLNSFSVSFDLFILPFLETPCLMPFKQRQDPIQLSVYGLETGCADGNKILLIRDLTSQLLNGNVFNTLSITKHASMYPLESCMIHFIHKMYI